MNLVERTGGFWIVVDDRKETVAYAREVGERMTLIRLEAGVSLAAEGLSRLATLFAAWDKKRRAVG
jgi:hypothetical protein